MLKLAVSNIAWCDFEDQEIASLLQREDISLLEAAPSALFGQAADTVSVEAALKKSQFWTDNGINIMVFQSLLFGKNELRLFGLDKGRDDLLQFLKHLMDLAQAVGVGRLVFGSPRNRLRGDLSENQSRKVAVNFFGKIGKIAAERNCVFCLEPNAADYGCDFVTHLQHAASIAREVNSAGFGMQLDTGVMQMNGERPEEIDDIVDVVRHVHCSQPFLGPVGSADPEFHLAVAKTLNKNGYSGLVSIEMKRSSSIDNIEHVQKAIHFAKHAYGAIV